MTLVVALVGLVTVNALDSTSTSDKAIPNNIQKIKTMIPESYEKTEASIIPVRNIYLMWTHDGKHIMWGLYGKGYLTGTDNLGKRAWGIYGKGILAGFYDGEFFWGRYRNGHWSAMYLFGEKWSHGRYVTFPVKIPVTEAVPLK
jgi:hypothetical protein